MQPDHFSPDPNALYLRRRRKVILHPVEVPQAERVPMSYVATFLKNIDSLGFACSPALIERMLTLDELRLVRFVGHLTGVMRALVGADVVYAPMYPNFPQQVMEADEAELYLNAMMHYLGDWLGVQLMPEYEAEPREPLPPREGGPPKLIDLGDEKDLCSIARRLIGAKTSISATDKEDVAWFIASYADDLEAILPAEIPHKENLSFATAQIMAHTDRADLVLSRYFKTATDVLRLAVALSDGDVSLAKPTKFRSFKRAERRLLLAMVERLQNPLEDMDRWRGRWVRLGERLHPGEYRAAYPKAAAAFDVVRSDATIETFASRVEAALREGDAMAALGLLAQRPGELARRLDHLIRLADDPAPLVGAFGEVSEKVATPVLLQVRAHFDHRDEAKALRAFFPKGDVAKVITVEGDHEPLPRALCQQVVDLCDAALKARFAELEPLGPTFVDETLKDYLVPFSQRSASKALRTLVRGSRVPMPEGQDTIRFFLWWSEGVVNGKATGRVDIDLSAAMYDADWKYKEHISYTNLSSAKYRAAHSGDITSAPNGACEFIDLDIPSILQYGGRYVLMSVLSYSSQPFCDLPECDAGWMMRSEPKSGEVFEPKTVLDKVDLTAATRICIPVVMDLVERKLIWADLALKSHPQWHINIEGNERGIVHMGRAITSLVKPSLHELFSLHAEARGQLTTSREEAETIFSVEEGTGPFDIEEIMAEYM